MTQPNLHAQTHILGHDGDDLGLQMKKRRGLTLAEELVMLTEPIVTKSISIDKHSTICKSVRVLYNVVGSVTSQKLILRLTLKSF